MLKRHGNWLIGAGLVLFALACALLFYDPEAGRVAFYAKAKTGFIIPTCIGAVLAFFGVMVKAGRRWALYGGLMLLLVTEVVCFMRWQKFHAAATLEPHKKYASIVVGAMAAVSLVALVNVARGVAFLPPTGDQEAG